MNKLKNQFYHEYVPEVLDVSAYQSVLVRFVADEIRNRVWEI
jgi:hypothetical protein